MIACSCVLLTKIRIFRILKIDTFGTKEKDRVTKNGKNQIILIGFISL